MYMEDKTLFARKATGLVRELGFTTAVLIAICNCVGLGWQKRVFQAAASGPVASTDYFLGIPPIVMAFFLVGILILISVYAFAVLSAAMPRSGGGYIFMSRILSPGFSFVATWLEFLSIAVSYGLIAVATFEATLIFGSLAGVDTSALAKPWIMTLIGAVVVVFFSVVAARGVRMAGRMLHIMFWIPAAILVLVYVLFLTANPQTMETGVGILTSGHTSLEYTKAAVDSQGLVGVGYWSGVFTAMFYAYWAYIGYAAASFVAGEVKEANRSLPRAMLTSGVIVMLIYITISILLNRAGGMVGQYHGFSLVDAVAWMKYGGGSFTNANLPAIGAWMPFFAGIQAFGMGGLVFGRIVGWILLIFAIFWVANDIPPFILTSSRLIFAMAFDRVLPEKLADVNEKWHSPVNAVAVTSIAALFGVVSESDLFAKVPGLGKILSSTGAVQATDLWDILFFAGMALACAFFPMKLASVYERSPFRQSKTTVQVIGWLAVAFNVVLGLLLIFHPTAYGFGPGNWGSPNFWFTVFLVLVGCGLYIWGRNRARRTGADLSTIFTAIPPE
jgi:APA family basic amino acid/polyamine antiporter